MDVQDVGTTWCCFVYHAYMPTMTISTLRMTMPATIISAIVVCCASYIDCGTSDTVGGIVGGVSMVEPVCLLGEGEEVGLQSGSSHGSHDVRRLNSLIVSV